MMLTPHEITTRMNAILAEDEQLHPPSTEQLPVVTAAWDRPSLVVAGAGSGKTETMANRMLWLVANEAVAPERVLGLTFTRKAAGELSQRFVRRLATLEAAGLPGRQDEGLPPTVSTYNAFANDVFREFAYLIGRSPDAEVLSETATRVLARDVVLASRDPRLARVGRVDAVVDRLIRLAAEMGDNLLEPGDLREHPTRLAEALEPLLLGGGGKKADRTSVEKVLEAGVDLEPLLDLVEAFEQRKRERNAVTFSDQVRLAIEVLERVPTVGQELRARHPIVLLDEYQDTSVMQVRLLSALFGGGGVMAVGDPNQSIYEWRGAAAGTLERFIDDFRGSPEDRFELSTSWRNDRAVLEAANRLAGATGSVMRLRARPSAGDGAVERRFAERLQDEAGAMAAWLRDRIDEGETPPTAAVLMRSRTWIRSYARALEEAGVDYVVVGGGGLLSDPAIVDLVAVLRVLGRPDASQSLLRIMASARWRIGAADMQALSRFSRQLARLDAPDDEREGATSEQIASIVDALDALDDAGRLGLSTAAFSAEGLRRLTQLAAELRSLRAARHRSGAELVRTVIRVTGIDVELGANEHADPRVLDVFLDELALMQRAEPAFGLDELLAWIDIAERDDRAELRPPAPSPGQVQIMTIHAAKGLEWDLVAIPALSEGTFPGAPRELSAGLTADTVPHQLRGDAAALPVLELDRLVDVTSAAAAIDEYRSANRARKLAEERRVAYVGVTRARRALWMSGHARTPEGVQAKKPSRFLEESGEVVRMPDSGVEAADRDAAVQWPPAPFGTREAQVRAAIDAVRSAEAVRDDALRRHLDALVAQRPAEQAASLRRIGASRLLQWIDEPALAERERSRPMPARRDPRALLGTVFHQWTEGRLAGGLGETLPGLEVDGESEPSPDLAELQRHYLEASRYTELELRGGIAELQIDLRIADVTVSCKIDAVFDVGDRVLIVDWKTGRAPRGEDLQRRLRQLSLYRIAYSELTGTPLDRIDAEFFFAKDATTVRLEEPMSKRELAELIERARTL